MVRLPCVFDARWWPVAGLWGTLGQGWIWIDLIMFLQDLQSEWEKEQMVKSYEGVKSAKSP